MKTHKLVLKNDDENELLYVVACLVRFCKHASDQAEQCAIITHNKGECAIKSGDINEMLELKSDLSEMGLVTEIEVYESNMC
jgi:ATP-dependent Clp protease adaptor protein ClpS